MVAMVTGESDGSKS